MQLFYVAMNYHSPYSAILLCQCYVIKIISESVQVTNYLNQVEMAKVKLTE